MEGGGWRFINSPLQGKKKSIAERILTFITMRKLLTWAFILHMLPKFLPFPFFIPFVLMVMGYLVYIAEKGTQRMVVVALLAFQFAPYPLTVTKEVSDIESWGNKGPNAAPMKGVYMFNGLGASTIDFSQCLWSDASNAAYCHLPKTMSSYAARAWTSRRWASRSTPAAVASSTEYPSATPKTGSVMSPTVPATR